MHSPLPAFGQEGRATSRSEAISAALQDFYVYIAAFNSKNPTRIAESLGEDVIVRLNGVEVARGRDTILPSYVEDFSIGKTVEMMDKPTVSSVPSSCNSSPGASLTKEVYVAVTLRATTSTTGEQTDLDIVYVYDPNTNQQIRHEIFSVRSSAFQV